jgi:hypothetical protein
MATTYEAIATVTVGSGGAANIEFTSIPGTYTDLLLRISARSTRSGVDANELKITFNNNTSNYSERTLRGSGSAVTSSSFTSAGIANVLTNATTSTASTFGSTDYYIPNYASANNKSVSADGVSENNGTAAYATFDAGLWSNSAAISSVKIQDNDGNNLAQYSTATLYGIKNS